MKFVKRSKDSAVTLDHWRSPEFEKNVKDIKFMSVLSEGERRVIDRSRLDIGVK